jgi:hypothetical protein
MKNKLPPKAKQYLSESIFKKIDTDLNHEFLCHVLNVNLDEGTGYPITGAGPSMATGGGGAYPGMTGGASLSSLAYSHPRGVKTTSTGSSSTPGSNVLMGRSSGSMGSAMGAYGVGKALRDLPLASLGAGLLKNTPMLGAAAKVFGKFLSPEDVTNQLVDLSGVNWFDANMKNLGANQQMLAAQGAGKPFVPLQVPKPQSEMPSQLERALAAAKLKDAAKSYGLVP